MVHRLTQFLRTSFSGLFNKTSYALWAPIIMIGFVWLWEQTPLAQRLEYDTVDLRFRARAPFDPPADPRLIYVGIDQPTLDQLGAWPWPRNIEAKFLDEIAGSGMTPNVVSFDLLFTEDSDKFHLLQSKTGDNFDQLLGDAAGQLPSVITGAFSMSKENDVLEEKEALDRTQVELTQPSMTASLTDIHGDVQNIIGSNSAKFPIVPLRTQSLFGFVNDEPDEFDGIRHKVPLVIRVRDKVFPTLSLQTICQMLNVDANKVHVVLGRSIVLTNSSGKTWTIPINEKGEFYINYRNNSRFEKASLAFYLLLSVLDDHIKHGDPIPPQCQIDKKTLFIAGSAIGLSDLGRTPLGVDVPLGFTHMNVINNVLRNDYISFVPWYWVTFGWLLGTWATLFNLRTVPIFHAVTVPTAVGAVYTAIAFLIFGQWSLLIDLVWPLLAFGLVNFGSVVLRWIDESRGREKLKKTFAQMVSPDLMNHLLDHPENLKLGGSKRPVTILFSDIRSFTGMTETTQNEELVRQLNRYFDRMVMCLMDYRGTLHGFTGDGIMAVWGDVSLSSAGVEQDARNAVHSALKMRRKLVELNEERAGENLAPLRIGIGLNHGPVIVGQMGASMRTQFSVVGDPVVIASRIEGTTKRFQVDLAIGENLRVLLGDVFIVRRLGRILLKGKDKLTLTYQVLSESDRPEESTWKPEELTQYETAFDHFMERRFAEAHAGFLLCAEHHPKDQSVDYYLKASAKYLEETPPENWDGRFVMETK